MFPGKMKLKDALNKKTVDRAHDSQYYPNCFHMYWFSICIILTMHNLVFPMETSRVQIPSTHCNYQIIKKEKEKREAWFLLFPMYNFKEPCGLSDTSFISNGDIRGSNPLLPTHWSIKKIV